MRLIWLAPVAALVAGCGSGSGSAAGTNLQPGTVNVALATQAASPATVLYAVEFTLHLPAGATLPADPASEEVTAGVLVPLDGSALAGARYLPAAAGTQASVKVNIADPGGFAVGSLATITCSVAAGAAVSASGFSLDGFSARDSNGAPLPGVTPSFTLQAH